MLFTFYNKLYNFIVRCVLYSLKHNERSINITQA